MSNFVTGLNQVQANLNNIKTETVKSIERTMFLIVSDLKSEAVKIAPKDTGDLRRSASTEVINQNDIISGKIGFNEPYALEQHENLTFQHTDGQAKYVETPLLAKTPKYKAMLDKAIASAIAKGAK